MGCNCECEKIAKELQEYQRFKKTFVFSSPDIIEKDGMLFCDGFPLYAEDGSFIPECEKWVNVGYKIKSSLSKLLSNLYPYEFEFRVFLFKSIEAFFQGIKFKDADVQRAVFGYCGADAYHIQAASSYDWKASGNIYWQGQAIKRDSKDYDLLVDEVYISAAQNPLYRQALKNVSKTVIHSIGKLSKAETVFTRYEFERQINCLSAFLKQED